MKANYKVLFQCDKYNFIVIQDLSNELCSMSITNDAEAVVEDVYKNHNLCSKDLYYVDTIGRVDKLLHEGEKFRDFQFGFVNLYEFKKHFKIEDILD